MGFIKEMMMTTETTTETAEPKTAEPKKLRTTTVFRADPAELVIDGYDNDNKIDLYNKQRLTEQPRRDDVMSIFEHGVKIPVTVRTRVLDDGTKMLVVVDGRQRVRRARIANELIEKHNSGKEPFPGYAPEAKLEKILVPCLPDPSIKDDDEVSAMIASIVANTGRVSDGPKVLAQSAIFLAGAGVSIERICATLARDRQTVTDWLALTNASSKVLAAMDKGLIGTTAAARLATLKRDKQNEEIEKLSSGGSKKVTKEAATVATKKAKAEGKGKKSKQTDAKRSIREIRLVQLGLAKLIAEADGRSAEAKNMAVGLATIAYLLGEERPDGEDFTPMFRTAFVTGKKIKKEADKAKGRKPKADKE